MREYKFRGRSIEPLVGDDQWVYGFGVHVVELTDGGKEYWLYTENGTYQVDPETVGQYTGVPDENGTDIYEKDRFKLGKDIGTVVFENGSFWVNWDEPYCWGIDRLLCNFRCRGEVVNPDLLEGGYE